MCDAVAQALFFRVILQSPGSCMIHWQANALTAGLGAANIALYAGVYTPLKVVSAANTWVGAAVGAVPPLMGWAAAAGTLEPGAGAPWPCSLTSLAVSCMIGR